MADQEHNQPDNQESAGSLTRRDFVAMSLAAGIAAAAGDAVAADLPITETDVMVKTPDGTCDAAFIHPTSGSHPGVLIWPDAFGLRPSVRDMARRLAKQGYSVLAPNPFYRAAKAPVFTDITNFSFQNTTDREKLMKLMGGITAQGAAERDAVAFVAFLDAQPSVNKSKKIGTQGYCMGGPLVVRTAAAVPDRIGAGASFHGGGLVTNDPSSPHRLASKIKARLYFGVASDDDTKQPDAKTVLKDTFKQQAEVEVYPSLHGWCMPDMPVEKGKPPIYNKADAEKAWAKLEALYKAALG